MLFTTPQDQNSTSEISNTNPMQANTGDSEVTMQGSTDDSNLMSTPEQVVHQILGELRDFRRVFDEKTSREESAGLAELRSPVVQFGNDIDPATLNHPLPPLPLRGSTLPLRTLPGQFPDEAFVSQLF